MVSTRFHRGVFFKSLLLFFAITMLSGCRPNLSQGLSPHSHSLAIQSVDEHCTFRTVTRSRSGVEQLVYQDVIGPQSTNQLARGLRAASFGGGPKTLNPWAAFDATSSEIGELFFIGLTRTNPCSGAVEPYLAKQYQVSPDGRSILVTLRRGLNWDGTHAITADDVVFTWNTILKQGLGNPSMRDILSVGGEFPSVRKLDTHKIQFQTKEPFAPFLRSLSTPIAPKFILEPLLNKQGQKAFSSFLSVQDALDHPERFVSSGPWRLKQLVPGQRIVVESNPHFFGVDQHGRALPYAPDYTLTFVKDQNALQLLFEQGELDWVTVNPSHLSRFRQLKSLDFTMLDLGPSDSTNFFAMNLSRASDPETAKSLVSPTKVSWFNSKLFRQALEWAIDRQLIINNVLRGVGQPLFSAESPNSPFLNQSVARGHPRDLKTARRLLKQAGFSWSDKARLLSPEGDEVDFSLVTNAGNQVRESTAVSIQRDLNDLGITVHVKPVEFNVLVDKLHSGHWETMLMGLSGSSLEPHFSANVWKSDGALHFMNVRTPSLLKHQAIPLRDWEQRLDHLFEAGANTLDEQQRRVIYDEYQALLADEQPLIYLFTAERLLAHRSILKGVQVSRLAGLHTPHAIWLDESLQTSHHQTTTN